MPHLPDNVDAWLAHERRAIGAPPVGRRGDEHQPPAGLRVAVRLLKGQQRYALRTRVGYLHAPQLDCGDEPHLEVPAWYAPVAYRVGNEFGGDER